MRDLFLELGEWVGEEVKKVNRVPQDRGNPRASYYALGEVDAYGKVLRHMHQMVTEELEETTARMYQLASEELGKTKASGE